LTVTEERFKITYLGFVLGHGGDALQMATLARGMQALGADVEIEVPSNAENALFVERCAALGLRARQSDRIVQTAPGSRQRIRSLLGLLGALNSDVLHVHAGDVCLPRTLMLALLITRRRGVIATLHSPYQYFEPSSARARFWAATARRTLRAVVSPSGHGTRFQRECGIPERLAVTIRNAIDAEAFSTGDQAVARASLGVDDRTPIVLFSSRLDPQKRPLDAVHAFARAAPEPSRAILVFVGSGEGGPAIIEEARRLGVAHRVVIAGYQVNVPDWLAAATVWIFPTERENYSIALLEAMAAGCPIVATVCPGNDEVLVDGSNALTFAVGDVATAADHVRRLLHDEALREQISAGARSAAAEHSVARMVHEYRQVYGWRTSAPP
jgi:glycosyltransferase involved in cell wall biosynthesis